jgi:hypothetical protein
VYGDLLDAPVDAALVLASFLLDYNRAPEVNIECLLTKIFI